MTWENIGSVNTGEMPDDQGWIDMCLKIAKRYIEFVCGKAPEGSELGIMWHDHDLGSYPSLGVWSEYSHPDEYVGNCERALEVFNDSVDWYKLKEHYEGHIFSEDEDLDDEID